MAYPRLALVCALTAALAGCLDDRSAEGPPVTGSYRLLTINDEPLQGSATLQLAKDGAITGEAPCNLYTGRNAATPPAIRVELMAVTRRACLWDGGEQTYFQALSSVRNAKADAKGLTLYGPNVTMRFILDPA